MQESLTANSRTSAEVKLLENLHKDKKRLEEMSSSGVAQVDVEKCKKGCEAIKKEAIKERDEDQIKNKRSPEEDMIPFILDMMNEEAGGDNSEFPFSYDLLKMYYHHQSGSGAAF